MRVIDTLVSIGGGEGGGSGKSMDLVATEGVGAGGIEVPSSKTNHVLKGHQFRKLGLRVLQASCSIL